MLRISKEFLNLSKIAKEAYNNSKKEIVDILVFGSFIKGKVLANDIDLCVVFRNRIDNTTTKKFEDKIKKSNIHISLLAIDNFFTKPHSLAKTLLKEGISLINKKSLAENLGFSQGILYSYSLKDKKQKDKTKIVYVLKGRDGKGGFVISANGKWLADSCFIVPVKADDEIKRIFEKWEINYERKNILIG